MITFKSFDDLSKLSPRDPARPLIQKFLNGLINEARKEGFTYNPENDGWTLLIEERADTEQLVDLFTPPRKLEDVFWNGVHVCSNHFVAVYLANNQFGLIFVIPDEDWLPDSLRRVLRENLIPNAT